MSPNIKMKNLVQIVVVATVIASMTGCASTKGYFTDRGRDAADIFSVAVGVGAGVNARVGPLRTGLAVIHDTIGLREGMPFTQPIWPGITPDAYDIDLLVFGGAECNCGNFDRFKHFETAGFQFPFLSTVYVSDFGDTKKPFIHSYYTQIEIAGGLIGTLRLGFNPGELLDFILGWATIDIFNDDLEARKRNEKSDKASIMSSPNRDAPKK
ncbi:MAG: hypothetical protein NTY53_22555 [Kiritimatiellaeota bacterium]|nr:hypothetical protein [Kiritimatiellota bacterium]